MPKRTICLANTYHNKVYFTFFVSSFDPKWWTLWTFIAGHPGVAWEVWRFFGHQNAPKNVWKIPHPWFCQAPEELLQETGFRSDQTAGQSLAWRTNHFSFFVGWSICLWIEVKHVAFFGGGVQKCSKAGGHGSQESPGSFVSKFEELELTSIFQYLDVYTLINYKERIFCSSELASVLPKINTLGCSNPIKDSPWNLEFSGTLFTPNIQNLSNGAMFGPWPKGLEIPKKQMKLSISNMFHL